MPKSQLKLESLEQIISASDDRQLAKASLDGLRELSAGDHFSAILYNMRNHEIDDYFMNQQWLAADSQFWKEAQQGFADHPMADMLWARSQSSVLVRSAVISDSAWNKTWIYNELERPLGVRDIATAYQITASGQVLILTCGRSQKFKDNEVDTISRYHRVLAGLAPFQPREQALTSESIPKATSSDTCRAERLSTLTQREHEILHWVRQGKRDPEIAIILGISPRTVHHHLAGVLRKLDVETRTAAAVFR